MNVCDRRYFSLFCCVVVSNYKGLTTTWNPFLCFWVGLYQIQWLLNTKQIINDRIMKVCDRRYFSLFCCVVVSNYKGLITTWNPFFCFWVGLYQIQWLLNTKQMINYRIMNVCDRRYFSPFCCVVVSNYKGLITTWNPFLCFWVGLYQIQWFLNTKQIINDRIMNVCDRRYFSLFCCVVVSNYKGLITTWNPFLCFWVGLYQIQWLLNTKQMINYRIMNVCDRRYFSPFWRNTP